MSIITTLDSTVTDDSLYGIDEFLFNVKITNTTNSNVRRMVVQYNEAGAKLEIVGNGYFTNSSFTENYGKVVNIGDTSSNTVYFSEGTYKLKVNKKYNLVRFDIGGNSTPDGATGSFGIIGGSMKYSDKITVLSLRALRNADGSGINLKQLNLDKVDNLFLNTDASGNLSEFAGINKMTQLSVGYSKITGDINAFSGYTTLTQIYANGLPTVTGDISVFSTNTNLSLILLNGSAVSGTFESLMDGLFANGKTSGTVATNFGGTQVTLNGVVMTGSEMATFTSEGWTV